MKFAVLVLIVILNVQFTAVAQIVGRVLDAETRQPIFGALIVSGDKSSISQTDGLFQIFGNDSIKVSAAGYYTQAIKFSADKPSIIFLHPLAFDLSGVTVTAFYSPKKLPETAAAVTIFPVGKLQQSGNNIAASLKGLPGVVMQEGTASTVKLTLRGIGSRYPYGTKKIKAFFDEIPLYSAEGETIFDDIAPEYLQRVELLRGPASSIYGASLGGTMILYPKRPESGSSILRLGNSVASYGFLKNNLSYADSKNERKIFAAFSRNSSDGYRENSRYNRNSFMLTLRQNFTKNLIGSLLLTGSAVKSQIPSSLDSATFVKNPQNAAPTWLKTKGYEHPDRIMGGYHLEYKMSESWRLSTSIFTTSYQTEENRPFNFLNESGINYGGRIVASYSRIGERIQHQLNFGTNLYFEKNNSSIRQNIGGEGVKGGLQESGRQTINQNDFFAQWEMRFHRVTLTGGVDLNSSGFNFNDLYSEDSIDQSGRYHFNPIVAPRLAFSWNPAKELNFYAAVNQGFSMPSLSETLSPLGLINKDIKPERANSCEFGARANLFNGKTYIDLAVYRMVVNDLIVPKRIADDVYVGMNAGSSLHRGIELSLQQWLWGKEKSFKAIARINGTINRFNFLEFVDEGIDYSGKKLPGMPDQQLSVTIDLSNDKGFYAQFEVIAAGKIPLNDLNSKFADGYALLNFGTGYSCRIFENLNFDCLLKISNIADEDYASMVVVNAPGTASRPPRYFYPGLPRQFNFSLGVNYIF